jgi:hypothetical protein
MSSQPKKSSGPSSRTFTPEYAPNGEHRLSERGGLKDNGHKKYLQAGHQSNTELASRRPLYLECATAHQVMRSPPPASRTRPRRRTPGTANHRTSAKCTLDHRHVSRVSERYILPELQIEGYT